MGTIKNLRVLVFRVAVAPDQGVGWGNPVIPPASTDAESPSNRN